MSKLSQRKINTILAALRNWQTDALQGAIDPSQCPIANGSGSCKALTAHEIDALCEDINTATVILK